MLLALVLVGVCSLHDPNHKAISGASHSHDSDNHVWSAGWQVGDCTVHMTANGDVWFTDDGKDVAKLAPGVKLTVVEESADHSRRVAFTEMSGTLEREYRLDGAAHPWDADAAHWFADLLVELDHQTGRLASIRFRQLMAAGGPRAVLDDMRDASGYAQGIYIRMLEASGKLGSVESCRLADLARDMNSDHERADVLSDLAAQVDFASAPCRDSYFGSVQKISSDYERARAMIAAVEHAPASGPTLDAFAVAGLSVTRDIASDHEKEHVLVTFAPRCTGDSARTAYLSVARTIASDAERARALTALVREQ
jgi:hypothetical protein